MRVKAVVAFTLFLPILGLAQELQYFKQFATLGNSMVADETGTYISVDSTRQEFPASTLFNKAISLKKFDNLSGEELWSHNLFVNENLATNIIPKVALDASGVYASVAEAGPNFSNRSVIRKFSRDGAPMWERELSPGSNERVMAIAAANGSVYAITIPNSSGDPNLIYGLNADNGDVLFRQPSSYHGLVAELRADSTGIYTFGGFDPGLLTRHDLSGSFSWERNVGSGSISPQALLLHPTGIYVGGLQFAGNLGFLIRFDTAGNPVSTIFFASSLGGQVTVRGVDVDSSGIYVAGSFSGSLDGGPFATGFGSFVRKFGFDGAVQWTKLIADNQFANASDLYLVQGALQIAGTSTGTFPGNDPDTGQRAFLARLTIPSANTQSISAIVDDILHPSASGLKGRVGSVCTQLVNLLRDVQRSRGAQIPAGQADLLIARIGEAQLLIGCAQ